MKDKFYSVYRVDHRGDSNPYVRVSETNYKNESDAGNELAYWQEILKRFPDGTKILVK
jgi:hypothetical protein